ncbi:presenilin-1-like isoform X1 [Dermacentor albipictus]|uniref:presenilin-1-like isoform X1 n=2 Tax=Dermacentor albipictus TaxID=60249 RepID=UPI0031FC4C9F
MSGSVEKAEDVEAAEAPEGTPGLSSPADPASLAMAEIEVELVRQLLLQLYEQLMHQVITLIVAVSICMLSVSVLTRVLQQSHNDYLQMGYIRFPEDAAGAETVVLMNSFGNAFSFLVMIVIVNCALVLLYKRGHYNIIKAWMITGSGVLLFLTGYYYLGRLAFYFNAPLDHLTCSLFIWNVGVTGITSLYHDGPFLMQQGYLVYISVLMAVALEESFPEWTSWILLVLVSVWDIFAVLCVLGPLRILLETAKERNEPLFPALVFSTSSAWCYAIGARSSLDTAAVSNHSLADKELLPTDSASDPPNRRGTLTSECADRTSKAAASIRSCLEAAEVDSRLASIFRERSTASPKKEDNLPRFSDPKEANDPPGSTDTTRGCRNEFDAKTSTGSTANSAAAGSVVPENRGESHAARLLQCRDEGVAADREDAPAPLLPPTAGVHRCRHHGGAHRRRAERRQAERESGDEMPGNQGMKMGLGDFIFYSVLVGKASRHGTALTVVACYVAVIVGILLTLSLLVYFQKPLPALPFSIGLGIAAYFSSFYLAEPFIDVVDGTVF